MKTKKLTNAQKAELVKRFVCIKSQVKVEEKKDK
jgi:hypothetical protein